MTGHATPDGTGPRPDGDATAPKPGDANAPKPDGDAPPAAQPPRKPPAARANDMAADIASKTEGGAQLDRTTMEQIMRDPDAMRAYQVGIDEVFAAVQQSNIDIGAETIELNRVEYMIRGLGFVKRVGHREQRHQDER
jgi:hypothetical protein